MPLPKNRWIYAEQDHHPPAPFRMGTANPGRKGWEAAIREAAKYAIRGATMSGTVTDFDPDALIQNLIVGMLGCHTRSGNCSE